MRLNLKHIITLGLVVFIVVGCGSSGGSSSSSTPDNLNDTSNSNDVGDTNSSNDQDSVNISGDIKAGNEITFKGLEYRVVKSSVTGKLWLDRNIGATEPCNIDDNNYSTNEDACIGDLFQFGRMADGHEKKDSTTFDMGNDVSNSSVLPVYTTDYDHDIVGKFAINGDWIFDWKGPIQDDSLCTDANTEKLSTDEVYNNKCRNSQGSEFIAYTAISPDKTRINDANLFWKSTEVADNSTGLSDATKKTSEDLKAGVSVWNNSSLTYKKFENLYNVCPDKFRVATMSEFVAEGRDNIMELLKPESKIRKNDGTIVERYTYKEGIFVITVRDRIWTTAKYTSKTPRAFQYTEKVTSIDLNDEGQFGGIDYNAFSYGIGLPVRCIYEE